MNYGSFSDTEIVRLPIPRSQKISRLLRQIERARRSFMDVRLKPLGLQGDMYLFLLTLHHTPGISQDSLAEHLLLDRGNAARVMARLERMGFLRRTVSPQDRRQYEIYLTPAGLDAIEPIRSALLTWEKVVLGEFSEEKLSELEVTLNRMLLNGHALFDAALVTGKK